MSAGALGEHPAQHLAVHPVVLAGAAQAGQGAGGVRGDLRLGAEVYRARRGRRRRSPPGRGVLRSGGTPGSPAAPARRASVGTPATRTSGSTASANGAAPGCSRRRRTRSRSRWPGRPTGTASTRSTRGESHCASSHTCSRNRSAKVSLSGASNSIGLAGGSPSVSRARNSRLAPHPRRNRRTDSGPTEVDNVTSPTRFTASSTGHDPRPRPFIGMCGWRCVRWRWPCTRRGCSWGGGRGSCVLCRSAWWCVGRRVGRRFGHRAGRRRRRAWW
jgi:hypothetical protein